MYLRPMMWESGKKGVGACDYEVEVIAIFKRFK
jgi:hypothetical protein